MATVICLHSGGFTSRQWKHLQGVLAPTHRVIAPDLLGYGASGAWPAGAPFHYQADVDALVALVGTVGEAVHLVGHSYGGFLACHVARALPAAAVRSLALYEPVTFSVLDPAGDAEDAVARAGLDVLRLTWEPDAVTGVDEAWLAGFVDWWNGAGAWVALPEDTRRAFRAVGEKLVQEVATLAADTTGAAGFAAIAAPALVMTGTRSPITEQRTCERLAAALPAGELRRFAGVGHMAPITHRDLVDAAIADFVRAH